MKAIITNDKLEIQDNTLYNSGSIDYYEIDVEFSSDWDNLTKYAVLVGAEKIKLPVVANKLHVDQRTSGTYTIGFVGYTLEDDEKTYQISTNLEHIYFQTGAGEIEANEPSDLPDPTTWETYLSEIQAIVNGAENVNISIGKIGDTTYITITDKTGTTSVTEVLDGKDAKINGVNTLTVEGGANVSIEQEGSTLIISATDTTDYRELSNKPKINNIELDGNKSLEDLGLDYPVKSVNGQTGDVTIFVPVKLSDLSNDTGFITNLVDNLANYYLKTEIYTKQEVTALINAIQKVTITIVEELPATGDSNVIYFVPKTGSTNDIYDEYIYISNAWEIIGSTAVDLSDYYTKTQVDTLLNGKANTTDLSTVATSGSYSDLSNKPTIPSALSDLSDDSTHRLVTDDEKAKLSGIETGAEVNTIEGIVLNGTEISPDNNKKVNLLLPTAQEVDDIEDRVSVLEGKVGKRYSVIRTITDNSLSTFDRADDAVGLAANACIGSLDPVQNDFDNIFPWSDIKDCNVDSNGNPTHFLGESGFTRDAEVYVYIPKHWIKREQYEVEEDSTTNKYEKITIYDYNAPGSIEIAPYMVGKYHTSKETINGVETHVSKTGLEPLNSTTRATFRTKAKAKGSKWGLLDWHYWDLCYLYLVEYADYNVDNTVGKGYIYGDMSTSALEETSVNRIVVSGTLPTGFYVGKTISIGTDRGNYSIARSRKITEINDYSSDGVTGKEIVFDGSAVNTTTSSKIWCSPELSGTLDSFGNKSGCLANDQRHTVVYRGIENLWGNLWQHIDGVCIRNYLAYICYDPTEYANDKFTSPYTALGYTNSSGNDSYIKEVGYDANNPLVALPTVVGGSSSTYVCDNYWSSSGDKILYVGGNCSYYGSKCGLFASNCNNASSYSGWSCGARLLIQAS